MALPDKRYVHRGLLVAAIIALALMAWFAIRVRGLSFDPELFFATFRRADLTWLAISLALMLVSYYGRVVRWAVMLEPLRPHPSHWNLFTATAIGFSAVILLGRAGELVRPYLISVKEKVPFSSQLAAWALERIYDVLIVLALFGFALAGHGSRQAGLVKFRYVMEIGGWAAGITSLLCLALLVCLHRWSDTLEQRFTEALGFLKEHQHRALTRKIRSLLDGLRSTQSLRSIVLLFVWSAVEWAIIILGYAAVFRAFPETSSLSISDTLVYLGFVAMGSLVQIPGIGGGVQVASSVALVELFGLSLSAAAGISVAVWFATFVVILPLGLLLAFREGWKWRKMKNLAEEVEI